MFQDSIRKNYSDNLIINFSKIIFCLLPVSLVLGPAPSDVTISLMGIFFIYFSFKYQLFNYYKNKYFLIFILFCAYLIIISILAENIYLSLESSLFYFRFGLFTLFVTFLIDYDQKIIVYFFYALLITLSIVILDGYVQYFFGSNLIGIARPNEFRLTGFFDEERILGSYVARLTPLLLALFIYFDSYSKIKIYLLYFFLVMADIIVYLSGERTSFFLISLATILFLLSISKFRITRLVAFVSSITIIFIITISSPNLKERMIDRPIESSKIMSHEQTVIFSESHNALYETAFKMFIDNPIFGHGPKMFREKCDVFDNSALSCNTHPHNTYLQLLAETGIIGFSFIFILFTYLSFIILRQILNNLNIKIKNNNLFNDYQICLLIPIYLSIWPFSPSFNFFNNFISIIYFLPVGFMLHEMKIFHFKSR